MSSSACPYRQHRVSGSHDGHVRAQVNLNHSGCDDNHLDPFVGNRRCAGFAGCELDQVRPKPGVRIVEQGSLTRGLFPSTKHVAGVRFVGEEIVDREVQPFGEGRDGIEGQTSVSHSRQPVQVRVFHGHRSGDRRRSRPHTRARGPNPREPAQ